MKKCDLKTFEVGHIYTLCDLFFGAIENKAKKRTMLTAKDWAETIEEAGIYRYKIKEVKCNL